MLPLLFFDIETAVNPDALAFLPEPTAPANYKDAEKIALYVSEKKAEQVLQAPLDADLGIVIGHRHAARARKRRGGLSGR